MSFAHWTCQQCLLKESSWHEWYHSRYKGDFCTYIIIISLYHKRGLQASLIAQLIKNLPAMQETQIRFLGREDSLEKEMTIHSSILAWKIPWTEEPGGLQSTGSQESDNVLATKPPPPHTMSQSDLSPWHLAISLSFFVSRYWSSDMMFGKIPWKS